MFTHLHIESKRVQLQIGVGTPRTHNGKITDTPDTKNNKNNNNKEIKYYIVFGYAMSTGELVVVWDFNVYKVSNYYSNYGYAGL